MFTDTVTATIPITLTALEPVHHGAGTSGNTARIRKQDACTPDGARIHVPFVSGASVRHGIRDALAWLVAEHCAIPDQSIPKGAVDLLWSGGALTASGAQTDLQARRDRHALLPVLELLGYSWGNDLVRGAMLASNVHLACEENRWRMPAHVNAMPVAALRASDLLGEEFGTRHDVDGGPVDRLVEQVMFGDAAPTTTQMIFDMEVVQAGSTWYLELAVDNAIPGVVDALAAALRRVTAGGVWHLGAKRAQGYGRCAVVASDMSRLTADLSAAADRHVDHLRGHAAAIREILGVKG
jgi:hypothetical protein